MKDKYNTFDKWINKLINLYYEENPYDELLNTPPKLGYTCYGIWKYHVNRFLSSRFNTKRPPYRIDDLNSFYEYLEKNYPNKDYIIMSELPKDLQIKLIDCLGQHIGLFPYELRRFIK